MPETHEHTTSRLVDPVDPVDPQLQARLQFFNEHKLPAVLTSLPGESIHTLLTDSRKALTAIRLRYGAILFRGFQLHTPQDFQAAATLAFENSLQDYIGGATPRGKVISGIFESTRFPATLNIPQHNEMSYLPSPPRVLAFFCEIPPEHGGETPLADSRLIYQLIPEKLRADFQAAGVSYHRYLYGPRWNIHHRTRNRIVKLHNSWMEAFSTTDPAVVERACMDTNSTVTWDRELGAKINNVLPAVRTHPETGEPLWFNQISSFLSSPKSVGWLRWLLYRIAYPNPFRRPLHATLGNGQPIPLHQFDLLNQAIENATIRFPWERGDLLLVDNFLVTHGRMPFRGNRRILVAMH